MKFYWYRNIINTDLFCEPKAHLSQICCFAFKVCCIKVLYCALLKSHSKPREPDLHMTHSILFPLCFFTMWTTWITSNRWCNLVSHLAVVPPPPQQPGQSFPHLPVAQTVDEWINARRHLKHHQQHDVEGPRWRPVSSVIQRVEHCHVALEFPQSIRGNFQKDGEQLKQQHGAVEHYGVAGPLVDLLKRLNGITRLLIHAEIRERVGTDAKQRHHKPNYFSKHRRAAWKAKVGLQGVRLTKESGYRLTQQWALVP